MCCTHTETPMTAQPVTTKSKSIDVGVWSKITCSFRACSLSASSKLILENIVVQKSWVGTLPLRFASLIESRERTSEEES